ncbi:beta strand repeat-containing protein [Burkholderia glumae]|uniref:beta strand repeat-containing protein n=1 Tax=Burkholderia glumae TaxID=337 RepID=UPI002150B612|nr:hypothetical protein [Burkholderia glumae]
MKKLLISLLLIPAIALAQSYPTPTFNSLNLQTPLTPANGGTGTTSATGTGSVVRSASPSISSPTLTGTPSVSAVNANLAINDSGGSNSAGVTFQAAGSPLFALHSNSVGNLYIDRYTSGTYRDSPFSMSSSTGAVTLSDGLNVGGSLSASGATFSSGISANGVTSTSNFVGPNAYSIYTSTGINNGGGIQVFDASHGNYVGILNNGTTVGQFGSYGATIGSSVYPTIVAPINTTATTTNGSANITVTSAAGITTGMGVYGSFSPNQCSGNETGFMGVYVTAVSGTTVTMSCPANATNSTPVAVQFGQQRYSPTSTLIASDIGAETLKVGSASQGNSASWLNQISTGQDYRLTSAAQIVSPPGGGYGITVASRTSDATGGAVAFPLQALFFADSGNPLGSEVAYFQSNLNPATSGYGPHIQFEQTIESGWTPGPEDPYTTNAVNATIAHRIDCGSGGPGGVGPTDQNCTTAIDVVPNNEPFLNGIVFANGSLASSGGRNALSMPLNYATTWFSGANQYSAFITSNSAGSMLLGTPSGGQYNFQINGSTSVQINSGGVNGAIGQTSPAAGSFTNLASSGAVNLAGSPGTAAAAGMIGEVKSAAFSNTSMTTSTVTNLTSVNLTAGVYLVWGSATYSTGTGATLSASLAGVSQNSGSLPALGTYFQSSSSVGPGLASTASAPMQFITLSSASTIYLAGDAIFSGGSVTASGFLAALRIH